MNARKIFPFIPEYYYKYIRLSDSQDLAQELQKSMESTLSLFKMITPTMEDYSYLPNKWTVKEVLQHIIDVERIFSYRAFRFSRMDQTELPGFDENAYIENIKPRSNSILQLQNEYESVRKGTQSLYLGMSSKMMDFQGRANGGLFTPKALGFIIVGHNIHHNNIILSRYLTEKL